jgi:hypothetical protein
VSKRKTRSKKTPPKLKPESALGVRKMFKEMQHSYDDDDDEEEEEEEVQTETHICLVWLLSTLIPS